MGRGRAPCCDKSKVKKGPWSPAEDLRLITFIQKNGHGNWRALPKQAGLLRCGKSCRLRWINYLKPGVKRGNFSPEEEDTIIKLHQSMGNKWSKIASLLPGRTDNEIKNVWNTHLKKRVVVIKDGINHQIKDTTANSSLSPSSSSTSFMSSSYDHDHNTGDVADEGCEVQVLDEKQDYPKVLLQSSPAHQPNQLPSTSSSSSSSSYQYHFSDSGQADVPLPKQEMGSFFDFGGPCEVHDDDDDQMMNKKGFSDDQTVEIPLESDVDFWDMLDNLDLFHESNEADQLQGLEAAQCSNLRESECRKWLRYLESELGLETRSSNGDNDNPPENDVSACDMMILSPEIEQGLPYFQMWPSSPHNFSV